MVILCSKEDLAAMQSRQRVDTGNGKSVAVIKVLWPDLEESTLR